MYPFNVLEHGHSLQLCMFQLCLLRSPAGGVDEEVVGFLSHLKEVEQLRKVEMTECKNLSPSLIATVCGGLCSSNSMEEVVVTSWVSVLSVCITAPYKLFLLLVNCPQNRQHLFRLPLLSLGGAPIMLYNCLVHTALLCSMQLSPLQFCVLCTVCDTENLTFLQNSVVVPRRPTRIIRVSTTENLRNGRG